MYEKGGTLSLIPWTDLGNGGENQPPGLSSYLHTCAVSCAPPPAVCLPPSQGNETDYKRNKQVKGRDFQVQKSTAGEVEGLKGLECEGQRDTETDGGVRTFES